MAVDQIGGGRARGEVAGETDGDERAGDGARDDVGAREQNGGGGRTEGGGAGAVGEVGF